jgi:F-type H+-transporting ATPase subunit a
MIPLFLAAAEPEHVDILHHLVDAPTFYGLDLSRLGITKHVWLMWTASAALIAVMSAAARQRGLVPRGLRSFLEPVLLFVRDELAVPNFHDQADRYLPYLWTVFFFILFCNLLGLVPSAATATGNLSVTAGLATISFVTGSRAICARSCPRCRPGSGRCSWWWSSWGSSRSPWRSPSDSGRT